MSRRWRQRVGERWLDGSGAWSFQLCVVVVIVVDDGVVVVIAVFVVRVVDVIMLLLLLLLLLLLCLVLPWRGQLSRWMDKFRVEGAPHRLGCQGARWA